MAVVPYTFANQAGQIPLSELDVNFANVKAFAETAGNVTGNVQANITALGTLSNLSVSGNVSATLFVGNMIGNVSGSVTGNISGNLSGNFFVSGSNTQVLFNDNGLANAAAGMSFNKTSNTLIITGAVTTPTVSGIGNVTGGNLRTNGLVSATGNITGGNITTTGSINARNFKGDGTNVASLDNLTSQILIYPNSAITIAPQSYVAANITTTQTSIFTNLSVQGPMSTNANVAITGFVSATGNITGGNILTSGTVSLSGNLIASGNTSLSGNAVAVTAANGTNTTQIATTAFVNNSLQNSIPAGVILLWSGSIASIPAGWALCDGGNSTPDLRNQFLIGAGSTYSVGDTGGSANAVVVAHTHTAISNVSDPGHNHDNGNFNRLLQVNGTQTASTVNSDPGEPNLTSSGNIQSNTTGITVTTTVASSGVSGTNANLPPYYALAYIMKL